MESEKFYYDNRIVKKFIYATMVWGIVGMLVGLLLAFMFMFPNLTDGISWLSFGRLRPLHTNAVIFAFIGNALFAGVYYSTQRLLKARMFSDFLSNVNFWGWQFIIVSAAITLPLGISTSKEYSELEWPIDIAIALIWVAFGWNLIGTILRRRQRHLYVAIWFYIATVVTVAVLHIFNSLALPASALKSYSVYAGVQDALVQWWYGHNAVAFFLTTPFLGLMYYFIPKATNRPIYSYRLSIVHFWSLIFIYIWAGPHHLLYTALPNWAQSLGVTFSVMLLMPSWGGMINGLLTIRGAWDKVRVDPVLKFFVVAITGYGMATFEDFISEEAPALLRVTSKRQKGEKWHAWIEGRPIQMTLLAVVSILIGGIIQIVPTLMVKSNIPTIAAVHPYTPLELEGRDIYIREGCNACHSQMIRPFRSEIARYGEYSKAGEFVYDHPFLWGSKRTGPDLHRIGGKYSDSWHFNHFYDPQSTSSNSIMPSYKWLINTPLDKSLTESKLRVMQKLGVPYSEADIVNAPSQMKAQGEAILSSLLTDPDFKASYQESEKMSTESGKTFVPMSEREIVAIIAYLQRLGTDIKPTIKN